MRTFFWLCLCLAIVALSVSTPPPAAAQINPIVSSAVPSALEAAPSSLDVPSDGFWDPTFTLEGVSGPVYASIVRSGNICIGGDFHQVGSLPAENIACWDRYTKTWSTFGSGLSGPVYALATDSNGKIYAGGQFLQAGGVDAQNIARWNSVTQAWEDMGGISGPVYALRFVGGGSSGGIYLYVGGQFYQAGQTNADNVARYDFTNNAWLALTDGHLANGVSGPVYALEADCSVNFPNCDIYVGGSFLGIGGVSPVNAYNIARWNTSGFWAEVGGSVGGPVYALSNCNGALHVGGKFSQAGTLAADNIASWNLWTTGWSLLGQGTSDTVEVLGCVYNRNRLYAGGRFSQAGSSAANHIARWNFDSKEWAALGGGTSGPVYAISFTSPADGPAFTRDVYVGGDFAGAGTTGSHNFARYTGDYDESNPDDANWDISICTQPGPNNTVKTIAAVGATLYYGGRFTAVGDIVANRLARYDSRNNTWSAVGAGVDGGEVNAIVVNGDYVYVGGGFTTAGGNPIPYLARWNSLNDTWEGFGSGPNGPVNAIAIQGSDVFIGGNFSTAGGVTVNNIARWDSSLQTWSSLGTGTPIGMSGPVNALAFLGNDLYAGGIFGYAQDVRVNSIARWNGSTWSSLSSGVYQVYVLAVKDSDLYVGGYFSTAGGSPTGSIARWDGAAWHALANGMGGYIYTIAFNQGDVYVGGRIEASAYNKVFFNVARWDGAEWWPLGSGVYGGGQAMAVGARGIYMGGTSLQNGMRCNGNILWKTPTSLTPQIHSVKSSAVRDGWVLETSETSNQGGTTNPLAATFLLGDNATKKQYRSILHFNTSSLPDNAVITKVVLQIKKQGVVGTNPFTTHGKIVIDIRKGAFSNNATLQATDFQAVASKPGVGSFANNPTPTGWYSARLTSTAYPYINRTGVTQFRLRFQHDDDNDSVADFIRFYSGNAIATNWPVLVITYYVP